MEDLIPEIITAVVVPLLGAVVMAVRSFIRTKLTPQRLSTVSQLARVAVDAAEEVGRAIDGVGPAEKFSYAEGVLKQSAKRVGVKLTNQEANAFIHSILNGKREELDTLVEDALTDILSQLNFTPKEGGEEAE